jgi:hypothetical protein
VHEQGSSFLAAARKKGRLEAISVSKEICTRRQAITTMEATETAEAGNHGSLDELFQANDT